jgi:hypothetical protein
VIVKHIAEAYEVLIDKQKAEIKKLEARLEEETNQKHFLLHFFVGSGGIKRTQKEFLSALEGRLAGCFEITKESADDLIDYVECSWGSYDASPPQP